MIVIHGDGDIQASRAKVAGLLDETDLVIVKANGRAEEAWFRLGPGLHCYHFEHVPVGTIERVERTASKPASPDPLPA